jgi:hypothetical protein
VHSAVIRQKVLSGSNSRRALDRAVLIGAAPSINCRSSTARPSWRCPISEKIGPVAAFRLAVTVARLPKTRSGKILRGTMKKIADHDPWTVPQTIEDPAILDEIGAALKEHGIAVA